MKRLSKKLVQAFFSITRPGWSPFISGDDFRRMTDNILDDKNKINPNKIKDGDFIFVDTTSTNLNDFFEKTHPIIKDQYVLITHNGDLNIDNKFFKYIDNKIIHWFAQNNSERHHKITPIPIGLANKKYYLLQQIDFISKNKGQEKIKKIKILNKFNINTNKTARTEVDFILNTLNTSESPTNWIPPEKYFDYLASYQFVASPPGNGIDCHRTWEAMLLKTIPIVKKSYMTEFFFDEGLPMFLITDWQELKKLETKDLDEIYNKLKPRFNSPALYFDYWKNKIIDTK